MDGRSKWRWVGDRALRREFPLIELSQANRSALALYRRLRALSLGEVEDVIPAARSVLVVLRPGLAPTPELRSALDEGEERELAENATDFIPRRHEIPVVYGGEIGSDLPSIAARHGLSEEEVIADHSSVLYTVGFLGFTPGFAYLIGLPTALATPRLATPRTRVPAGSVAIGGEYTGIYPRATPGGWSIIGRTDVTLFDFTRDPPALFQAGDQVRFLPI
ncbi:MAG: 5-oxoprolinase subunit PxpB [Candidatus Binatia bacterium]